ncbi:MBL fold metallo-hydrolase [Leptolinea tardivitalis]|uniref:Metallo-beta-lactamase domain-containing protein n=1 Tax=Leptolinea tardivitalis TaxID=229920 RepID=A0A0P6XD24_9CHLR|nr:MBL fold metallo-hydrolase [Leptolinea tardivitalis]KPL72805.1 hypothetical protein ADM99_06985 [Leptolinea tardivitalis]GAP20835.1 Zn-dependent hydrolase [Leptolinea tardivitalis]
MSLKIETFILGPIDNNSYLLWDEDTRDAAVIDPSFDAGRVAESVLSNDLNLTGFWLTHGHFDHFVGTPAIIEILRRQAPLYLHKADLAMFADGGLARQFGFPLPDMPNPTDYLTDGQILQLGESKITVWHTPGHSPGHVIFYAEEISMLFTGDLIFRQSVGRTDLTGADSDELLRSIYNVVLPLPGETILLSGHGEPTTIDDEVEYNPYLN